MAGEDDKVKAADENPEKEKLLKHEDAAKALGKKSNREELEGSWTSALILSVFASTLGTFQFGYHIGCINVPAEVIKRWYIVSHKHLFDEDITIEQVARVQWAVTVAIFAIGGMIGGLASGWFADKFGRKGAMMWNNILAVLAAIFMTSAKYVNAYPMMIAGRIIIGINSGLTSGLVPMYMTEISPINLRGALGSAGQLLITIGILVSQIIGLPSVLGSSERWPMVFAFTLIPVIVQFLTLPLCPESPKYNLIIKSKVEQAEMDLKKLRGKDSVDAELEGMKEEARVMASMEKVSMGALFSGQYAWPMFLAIMLMCGQQLSGINVAIFFSTQIFEAAGLGEGAVYATLGMGALNVAMTIVSVYLVDHPKFGRVLLLLTGFIGMLITSILLTVSISIYNSDPTNYAGVAYASMIFVLLFVISFATGPGSIPWFYVSELFALAARGNANSIAVLTNWTANCMVGLSFETLYQLLKQYAFLVFSAIVTFFIFFIWMYVPETKGKTVEEVNEELARGKSRFARAQKAQNA